MAQKASEIKWENFRVVMLSLTRKPLHRGIIKQRGTQAACGCVLNSERFVIPREGQKLPFHVSQWGRGQDKTQDAQYVLYAKVLGFGVHYLNPMGFIFTMLCGYQLPQMASSCCRTFDTQRLC